MKKEQRTQLTVVEDIYDLEGRQQGTQGLTPLAIGIPEVPEL